MIIGDLPANPKKVQHFLLRLSISAEDDNRGNDEKKQGPSEISERN